jgi:hypothetical protein
LTNKRKVDKIVRTFQVRRLQQETQSRIERGGRLFNARERSRPNTFLAFPFVACLLPSGVASAAPSIALSKKSGPPTSEILVSGRGFKTNVIVNVYFDTKNERLVVTDGNGAFDPVGIHVPRSARPGEHRGYGPGSGQE